MRRRRRRKEKLTENTLSRVRRLCHVRIGSAGGGHQRWSGSDGSDLASTVTVRSRL